jgi:hypothetical protein
VLVATFGVLALSVGASAASAKTPCWRQIQNEWVDTNRISPTYPLHCYREAIAHVAEDLLQYSSFEEVALAARQLAARQGRTLQGRQSPPSSRGAQHDPDLTLFTKGFDKLGPDNADSMPLPLLILAGLSLLLIAAGAAGLVTRRVRARKVPG